MNPEPIFLDFILDTPIKAVELRKRDVPIYLNGTYNFRRPDCIDIYHEFFDQVIQLRKFLNAYDCDGCPTPELIDLLDTKVLAPEISGITFCITAVEGKYSVSTLLHNHSHETLLKTRLEKREDIFELLKKDTNTRSEVHFYLTELQKIDKSIRHLHQQHLENSILKLKL